jgi:hypothetical protein
MQVVSAFAQRRANASLDSVSATASSAIQAAQTGIRPSSPARTVTQGRPKATASSATQATQTEISARRTVSVSQARVSLIASTVTQRKQTAIRAIRIVPVTQASPSETACSAPRLVLAQICAPDASQPTIYARARRVTTPHRSNAALSKQ